MLASKIASHEESFKSSKKDTNGTEYTFNDTTYGNVPVCELTPSNVSDYYYETTTEKTAIVLHFTAGYLKGDLGALCKNDNHVSVPFVIARDGTIYKLFDPKYWSYHLGKGAKGGNTNCSKKTIAIEISNIGPLTKSGDEIKTVYGDKYCGVDEKQYYQEMESEFRGYKYFATFTDQQYDSLQQLLSKLCGDFSIPCQLLDSTKRYSVFATDDEAKNYKGICSHINYRESGKWDIGEAFEWDRIIGGSGGGTGFFFPIDIGKGYEKSDDNIQAYYKHTEVDHPGGYFPLGANTVWHGGVHIHAEHRAPVKVVYDGEIIGGKLAFEEDKANGEYGSHNFLIVKHTITGKALNAQFGDSTDASVNNNPQVQEKVTVKQGDNLQDLAATWNTTIDAIRTANPGLEDHYGASGATSWYWAGDEVVRPVTQEPEPAPHPDSLDDDEKKTFFSIYMHLNNEELDLGKNEKLKEISWLPERIESYKVKANINIRKATHFEETLIGTLKAGVTLEPLSQEKIKNKNGYDWIHVKVTSGELKDKTGYVANSGSVAGNIEVVMGKDPTLLKNFKSGEIVKVENVKVSAGDTLWTCGKYGSDPVPLLHWEVFSEENLFPSFEKVEDDDQDFTMDCDKVFKLVNQNTDYWSDDTNLDADEVYSFYKEQSEKSISLRKYACKFTPEWAVNLDAAIDSMKGRWYTWGLKERLEPYVWWERAVSAGIDIPKKKPLWFYNPVSMVQCLGEGANAESGSKETSEDSLPQSSDDIHTDWTNGYNRNITDQNKFNDYISNSTKERNINPFILKSLIAQESSFNPKAYNNGGFAGLTQVGGAAISTAGFDIGDTKKVSGKWEFDLSGDERFDPEKSIEGGAKVLAAKVRSVDVMVFKHYTSELTDDEKLKFYLAAYNGGEGTVQKAYKACGKVNAKWEDLIEGKESSGLWSAIPESWGREAKYEEITTYVKDILRRAAQDGADTDTAGTEESNQVLRRGNFDDVAVEKYSSRTTAKEGYVAGKKIEKLQKDLKAVGITAVGIADGDFGEKTETAVKEFQRYALKEGRYTDSSCQMVDVTFNGNLTGIADQATLDELKLWLANGYLVPKEVNSDEPKWIEIAKGEIGQKEIRGGTHNPRVLEYHDSTTLDASTDEVAWCSSYVNWCIKKAGYKGTNSARALSWEKWGKKYNKPAYGAVAIIAYREEGAAGRNGKGHVGFVVGKKGDKIVVLGGNQGNQVKLSVYDPKAIKVNFKAPKKDWIGTVVAYVLPENHEPSFEIPEATGSIEELGNTR